MCEECYERTVPSMEDIKKTVLMDNEDVWRGTYLLESGNRLRCHECYQFDEKDWNEEDEIVGSIYFEIDKVDENREVIEDWEGGEMGFNKDATFLDLCHYILICFGEVIVQKISDDD